MDQQAHASTTVRAVVSRLAPGTALRDGLERILRGRTGGLIVLGYDELVEDICDGGFHLDVAFAPTRMRELAKMDGAVVLTGDGDRIVRANVQLVPDPSLPTQESGTRHRAAQRTAIQTGYPVVSVSQSMSIISLYIGGTRYVLDASETILSRANQTLATLERYRIRLDEVNRALSISEIEDYVILREVLTVLQRLEMVRRLSQEIEYNVIELGVDGRQLALQLEDLVGGKDSSRELLVRDYLPGDQVPDAAQVRAVLTALGELTDSELLDTTVLARILGYPATLEALDQPISPRGFRLLHRIPRLQHLQIDRLVAAFGTLQNLLATGAGDLQAVDGIGDRWARHIREAISRLAEAGLTEHF